MLKEFNRKHRAQKTINNQIPEAGFDLEEMELDLDVTEHKARSVVLIILGTLVEQASDKPISAMDFKALQSYLANYSAELNNMTTTELEWEDAKHYAIEFQSRARKTGEYLPRIEWEKEYESAKMEKKISSNAVVQSKQTTVKRQGNCSLEEIDSLQRDIRREGARIRATGKREVYPIETEVKRVEELRERVNRVTEQKPARSNE